MHAARPFEVLLLVDFSDLCLRTAGHVARLADAVSMRLTLLHVRDAAEPVRAAQQRLARFIPEADRSCDCERLVAAGEPLEVLEHYAAREPVDLVLLPASTSSAFGSVRPSNPSRRLEVLDRLGVPLWTVGPPTDVERLDGPIRNVACWLDLTSRSHPQLAFAAEYARALNAQLHLLGEVPEPTVSVIRDESIPLAPAAAADWLLSAAAPALRSPQVWVAEDDSVDERRRLLRDCAADVLFVPQAERPLLEWFGSRPRWFTEPQCPVVMVPSSPRQQRWRLASRSTVLPRSEVVPPRRRAGTLQGVNAGTPGA